MFEGEHVQAQPVSDPQIVCIYLKPLASSCVTKMLAWQMGKLTTTDASRQGKGADQVLFMLFVWQHVPFCNAGDTAGCRFSSLRTQEGGHVGPSSVHVATSAIVQCRRYCRLLGVLPQGRGVRSGQKGWSRRSPCRFCL